MYNQDAHMVFFYIKSSVDIDLMPGEFDPANYTLPQQPLHKCMFPQASRYPTFQTVTNPYDLSIEGVRYLILWLSYAPITKLCVFRCVHAEDG